MTQFVHRYISQLNFMFFLITHKAKKNHSHLLHPLVSSTGSDFDTVSLTLLTPATPITSSSTLFSAVPIFVQVIDRLKASEGQGWSVCVIQLQLYHSVFRA